MEPKKRPIKRGLHWGNGRRNAVLEGKSSRNFRLDGPIAKRAITGFLERRVLLRRELPNWSIEGRIKMGRALQAEARCKFDFNQAESYSLWLSGAWLESGARCSDNAASVHDFLERLAHEFED